MNSILVDVIGDKLLSCPFVQKGKWYTYDRYTYGCVLQYGIAYSPKGGGSKYRKSTYSYGGKHQTDCRYFCHSKHLAMEHTHKRILCLS